MGMTSNAAFSSERDKVFWDKKYGTEAYIFGKEPVAFLREHIDVLPKGKALDVAMGEGRNAVFLAKNGFEVDGCDISEIAVKKGAGTGKGSAGGYPCLCGGFRDLPAAGKHL